MTQRLRVGFPPGGPQLLVDHGSGLGLAQPHAARRPNGALDNVVPLNRSQSLALRFKSGKSGVVLLLGPAESLLGLECEVERGLQVGAGLGDDGLGLLASFGL
ncbi:hypothetical protein DMH04_53825 [Kibdelosporangium aridum]|uniref:Uncharacterized protein n=1 Tax=Kibdelosporangium aridum TaxID=2030 RepID=A0A428Y2D8_KIBAR|nr:hypothetical protein [Kibdelosporangium aridum]RSM61741.1 hypothetical protein DMH04_53825 [Kibdelosporangium aridum]